MCTKCESVYDITEFSIIKSKLSNKCKTCISDYRKSWRQNNKDKTRKYNSTDKVKLSKKMWLCKNSDYHKEYYIENKDSISEYKNLWYFNNRDYILNKAKDYYDNNKNDIRVKVRERYERIKNTEHYMSYQPIWALDNLKKGNKY
jgi:hypothetical protein